MSRILRRPMFRGGRVSSYGTGIASGLADGGRVNLYRGGGPKTKTPTLNRDTIMPWDLGTYSDRTRGGAGAIYQGIGGPMWTGSEIMNYIKDNPKWGGMNFANTLSGTLNTDTNRWEGGKKYAYDATTDSEMLGLMRNMMDPDLPLIDPDKTAEENTTVDTTEIWDDYDAGNEEIKKIETVKKGEVDGEGNDPSDLDTDDLAAMVSKYEDLLGIKEAKGKDIADMLLSAGSKFLKPGATVKGGFSEFLGEEAKKGPGRGEKIKQAATMLAIKGEQAKDAAKASMESAVALKLVGITDKNKERAFTTRVADYTKEFMKDPYNQYKQKNAGSFANALVMSENLGKNQVFVGVMEYDTKGEATPEAGVIYIDPMAIIKGTPFYFNGTHYKTHKEAIEAQQGG